MVAYLADGSATVRYTGGRVEIARYLNGGEGVGDDAGEDIVEHVDEHADGHMGEHGGEGEDEDLDEDLDGHAGEDEDGEDLCLCF